MNKSELSRTLATKAGIPITTAEKVVNSFIVEVTKILASGERVPLKSFGVLDVAERKKRMAKNPRTGEPMVVPASKYVRFKPSTSLKGDLN